MKLNIFATLLAIGSLAALASGCAVDSAASEGEADDNEEASTSHDELTSYANKIAGEYKLNAVSRPPTFVNLTMKEGFFEADVDTGIRCVRAPCPSSSHLFGKYSVTKTYLTLSATPPTMPTTYHGRYKYKLTGDRLELSRAGAIWNGWNQSLDREVPKSVWTPDATEFVALNSGGGFTAPPPPGSKCATGREKYTVDVATKTLAWERCLLHPVSRTLQIKTGSESLNRTEYAKAVASIKAVTVSTRNVCGADKPMKKVTVTNPTGATTYTDDFYSCTGTGPFVENIDQVFATLRAFAE